MATINDIANGGLRKLGIITAARPASAYEIARAIEAISDFLASFPLRNIGGKLDEVSVTENIEVDVPARLQVSAGGPITITLPPKPFDGYTLEINDIEGNFATHNVTLARNGRKIAGAASSATLSTNNTAKSYFYRADLGDWTEWASSYAGSDTLPLPDEFIEGMKNLCAVMVCDSVGVELSGRLAYLPGYADTALRRLSARYAPKRRLRADRGLTKMPSQVHSWGNTSVYRR